MGSYNFWVWTEFASGAIGFRMSCDLARVSSDGGFWE